MPPPVEVVLMRKVLLHAALAIHRKRRPLRVWRRIARNALRWLAENDHYRGGGRAAGRGRKSF